MGPKNIRTDGLDDDGRDGTDWVEALGFGEDYEDLKKDGFEIKEPIEFIEEKI